jgi:hypothetical protein
MESHRRWQDRYLGRSGKLCWLRRAVDAVHDVTGIMRGVFYTTLPAKLAPKPGYHRRPTLREHYRLLGSPFPLAISSILHLQSSYTRPLRLHRGVWRCSFACDIRLASAANMNHYRAVPDLLAFRRLSLSCTPRFSSSRGLHADFLVAHHAAISDRRHDSTCSFRTIVSTRDVEFRIFECWRHS